MKYQLLQLTCLAMICAVVQSAHTQPRERDLPQETADPTAPLASITLQAEHTTALWGREGQRTTYNLTVANPFYLWKQANLLHIAIPYNTGTGINAGQGSTLVTNLLIYERPWGKFGLGAGVSLSAPQPWREGIQYGPAWGVVRIADRCRYGVLNVNYLSNEVSISGAQLIAGCSLGDGWAVSAGNFTALYNWRTGSFLELPLSVQLGRVVKIDGQPLQFFVNPRYNIQDTPGTDRWKITVGVTFVADQL